MKAAVTHCPVFVLGFFFTLWALFVGAVLALSSWAAYENHLFADYGRRVDGTVLERVMEKVHGSRGSVQYVPTILYTYQAGDLIGRCRARVREETWYDVTDGGTIPIAYLPENPARNRIDLPPENGEARQRPILGFLFAFAFLALGSWGFWYYLARNRLYQRLVNAGTRCRGEVLCIAEVHGGRGAIQHYLTFRFQPASGEAVEGRSEFMYGQQLAEWRVGDLIDVWYDPAQPRDFVIDLNPRVAART